MNKCGNCTHWNMEHTLNGHNGCRVWNNYKHLGKKPEGNKLNCPNCGDSLILDPSQYESSEEWDEAKDLMFENNLISDGPKEPFEGWAKGFGKMLTNLCIITKEDDSCKYYKLNKEK